MAKTYDIASRTTFMTTPGGSRVMFRSLLEARWALTFSRMSIEWSYEPRKFDLPNGGRYTPDFYLDEIGWIEIKPTFDALLAVEGKLGEFARWADELTPEGTIPRVFSITADAPTFEPVCRNCSPVMEWSDRGVTSGNWRYGLEAISTETGRQMLENHPGAYGRWVHGICEFTSGAYFDGPYTMPEAILLAFQGWKIGNERSLQPSGGTASVPLAPSAPDSALSPR